MRSHSGLAAWATQPMAPAADDLSDSAACPGRLPDGRLETPPEIRRLRNHAVDRNRTTAARHRTTALATTPRRRQNGPTGNAGSRRVVRTSTRSYAWQLSLSKVAQVPLGRTT